MKKRTSRFISLLWLISCLCCSAVPVQAQQRQDRKDAAGTPTEVPFYQGMAVGLEVAGPISHYVLGSDIFNTELQLQCNLKNRFLPTLEVGYGKTDSTNDDNDMHYKTSAPYFRIGMDYNVFHKKPYLPGYLAVGLRYALSSFKYDVGGPDMEDPHYGGSVPFRYEGIKSNASWIEAVVGVKVRIYKAFHMGWSLRYKMRLSVGATENAVPWYVPGFGKNSGTAFNLNYHLMYNLPF